MTENYSLTLTVAAMLVVASVAAGIGAATVQAQNQNSDDDPTVSISVPSEFSTKGEHVITVSVTNPAGNSNTFPSPDVEIPITDALGPAPDATDNAEVSLEDGSVEPRAAETAPSTFRTGDAMFIHGNEVPPGETREYRIAVTASSPGSKTLEAKVRPQYSSSPVVTTSKTVTVKGTGTLDASVETAAGGSVSGASVTIDGTQRSNSISETVVEGTYAVSASGTSVDHPEFTVPVGVGDVESVTFVVDSRENAKLRGYTGGSAQVVGGVNTLATTGDATTNGDVTIAFNFTAADVAVFDVGPPADRPVRGVDDSTVYSATNADESTRASGAQRVHVDSAASDAGIRVEFTGYELGNVDGAGTGSDAVDASDASSIAANATDPAHGVAYGDVNGDGSVTAADAMLAQQYADGNRTADYGGFN